MKFLKSFIYKSIWKQDNRKIKLRIMGCILGNGDKLFWEMIRKHVRKGLVGVRKGN